MDFKKSKAPLSTVTRNLDDIENPTGNLYESLMIIAKRSNQISAEMKQELSRKLEDFLHYTDTLEEVFENKEQIEISRFYERLSKPTLIAVQEFLDSKIYYRQSGSAANPSEVAVTPSPSTTSKRTKKENN